VESIGPPPSGRNAGTDSRTSTDGVRGARGERESLNPLIELVQDKMPKIGRKWPCKGRMKGKEPPLAEKIRPKKSP